MTLGQGFFLAAAAIAVVAISIWQNRGMVTKSWRLVIKAGCYLVGAALLLLFAPSAGVFGGWSTLVCFIIAVLSVLIVLEVDTERILRTREYGWKINGNGGLKALYMGVKIYDRIDAFVWKKRGKIPRIRLARRLAFVVLVVFIGIAWIPQLIGGVFGLFSSDDEASAMGVGSSGADQSQSAPAPITTTVSVSATTTPPATTTTTATTTPSASAESLDQSCAGPLSSALKPERKENVTIKSLDGLWVCRDGGQWLAWKEGTVGMTVTILSWTKAVAPEDGLTYTYAVIEANAKQYYVKSVPEE